MNAATAISLRVTDRRWRYKASFIGERAGHPGKRFEVRVDYVVHLRHAIRVALDTTLDCVVTTHDGDLVIARRGGTWFCRDNSPLRTVNGVPLKDVIRGEGRFVAPYDHGYDDAAVAP